MNDAPQDDLPSASTADGLKKAMEMKRAVKSGHAGLDGGRDGERQAAALSASRSKPAARRLSKRG